MRIDFPEELPISARAAEITEALRDHPVIIVAGETGSGKTTQVPKMCLAAGRGTAGRIACTQPRRVAALSLSRRVAEELRVPWGREVGCKVRFADDTSPETVIKFLTDGMLLAEAQGDPLLREYDTVVVDEAHERSLNIDFLLGHLRQLRHRRPDLRIVITSATIDTDAFSRAFDGAPVIVVEGRLFPVEVVYAPLDALGSDADEDDDRGARAEGLHYVDGAVEQAGRIADTGDPGDVLVFMPSERDIRETCELLAGRLRGCEVVPLFGRLSNAEQQRIFAPGQRRRIVVATNIAETSLTIPGIRYVVDTGLARVSRYAPQSRTRRLPIEPVSRSSADQRKGRCGRVADGVCIRLYSEEDYLARPRFTQPEIQRANLADVILRLKSSGLGEVETFPFIDPPAPKAVRSGYLLLEELGAFAPAGGEGAGSGASGGPGGPAAATASGGGFVPDSPGVRQLTPIGRELGRLPVDPTVARMILQARTEKALREVLVIAAGLSIQDPRERPADQRAQADAAHRRFANPDSDFLTLLNIWEAFHGEVERMTQGRLRVFCRSHHLSYLRMREWRDVHAQLLDFLADRREYRPTSVFDGIAEGERGKVAFGTPAYRAIHRSILSGLLGGIACLDEENGGYRAAHDRRVALFPGSVLHTRAQASPKAPHAPKSGETASRGRPPRWIMAAEIVETSRLFARTCARIDPGWALDLGAHLVRVSHSEPFWNPDNGRVLVRQRTRLYGLEIDTRAVGYGRIDPEAATDIFIREALVNDTLNRPLDFLEHNRRVRERVETLLTRARNGAYLNLDEGVRRFYADRISGVSSVAELAALVRERRVADPRFLYLETEDLRGPEDLPEDSAAFPDALPLDNRAIPIAYAYKPGTEEDGVSVEVPAGGIAALTAASVDWAVPGHLAEKVEHYLRSLPKELRRAFVPLAENAARLSEAVAARDRLTGRRETVAEALAAEIGERHRIRIDSTLWSGKPLPDHLRVRIRVVDAAGRELAAGRDLPALKADLERTLRAATAAVARDFPDDWRRARERWETTAATDWRYGEIPSSVLVAEQAGVPIHAFPGLLAGPRGVALRLFRTPEEARGATVQGLAALLAEALRKDLAWLEKDVGDLRAIGALAATLAPTATLAADACAGIRAWITARPVEPLSPAGFAAAVEAGRADLRGLVPRFTDRVREILTLRQELMVEPHPYAGLQADVDALLPPNFLRSTPHPQLARLPCYLRAMKLRCERARRDPVRDRERMAQLAPYVRASGRSDRIRWLVEEFRVSLFAQELGTAEPVSAAKLDRLLAGGPEESDRPAPRARAPSGAAASTTAAAPASAPVPGPASQPPPPNVPKAPGPSGGPRSGSAPIKSLSALDRLFPRPG